MSKHSHESPRRGESLLKEWGIGDDVTSLRGAWGREAEADAAILERLAHLPEAASVTALIELENATADKAVRKEIRRALFRLEQRGLAVPRPQAAPTVASLGGPEIEGYISASDGNGDQLLWLVKPRRGELLHFFTVINDPGGMREAALTPVTRKTLKSARDELRQRHDIRIVETDWHYVDERMREAYRWATQHGAVVSGDYLGLRNQLLQEQPTGVVHPVLAALDADRVRNEPPNPVDAAALLQENELRTWFFPPEVLVPYLQEVAQAQSSPVLLNEHQQRDRVEQIIVRAIEEIFGGETQASWVRRLLDLAWVLHATQRDASARQALSAALALESSTQGGAGIPVCEALVRFSFAAHVRAAAEREQERQRDSLILTPQEAAAQAARAQRRGPR